MTHQADVVDEQTAALLRSLRPGPHDPPPRLELSELRQPWPADAPELLPSRPLPAVTDLLVPGPVPVPIRLFVPAAPGPRPALVWLHPGGFVAGEIDDIDGVCRELAASSGSAVISIEYRLAPENTFPAALDDVTNVVRWLGEHGHALGVDATRLAIGGQSAGATLAAGCAWQLHEERAAIRPALQILAYPVLDPRLDAPSYVENADGYHFTTERLAWCWRQYLGHLCEAPPPAAAPLYAESVRGLPPALILTAGRDPARDDSRRYRDKLVADGVHARLVEYPHTIHAFLSFAGVLDVAKEALSLIAGTVREQLGSGRPWLHHVTLPYAPEREREVRQFYDDVLGLTPKPAPAAFDGQGFIWFIAGSGDAELHLIPEDRIDGDSQRHACFATDRFDEAVERLRRGPYDVQLFDVLPDRPQAFVRDPAGNLLELTSLPEGK